MAHAFHRAIYVFCCKKSACFERRGAVKCFRTQLPRKNPHYCFDPDTSLVTAELANAPHKCEVCGCKALHACSQCKAAHYCHRTHQKMHWKAHKHACNKSDCASAAPSGVGFCFAEHEIVVEAEELLDDGNHADVVGKAKPTVWEDAGMYVSCLNLRFDRLLQRLRVARTRQRTQR